MNGSFTVTVWDAMADREVASIEDIRALAMCSSSRGVSARGFGMTYVAYPEHVRVGVGGFMPITVANQYYDDLTDKERQRMVKLKWSPCGNGRWESPLKALSRAAE